MKKMVSFLSLWGILGLLVSGVWAAEPPSPPTILSANLGGVSYLSHPKLEWVLVVADSEAVTHIRIDQKEQKIEPGRTVTVKKLLTFNPGKNTLDVEAQNKNGLTAQRTFVVYYAESAEELEAFKQANLPAEERTHYWIVTAGVGMGQERNPAQLWNSLSSVKHQDRAAGKLTTDLGLGYRRHLRPDRSQWWQAQYNYFQEGVEDKTMTLKDSASESSTQIHLKDLGLQAHALTLEWGQTQEQQACHLSYTFSRMEGDTTKDDSSQSIAAQSAKDRDNGDNASFHFLVPTYTRVHHESLTSVAMLTWALKSFDKEPKNSDYDRDSNGSLGLTYQLFYYLPGKIGRLQGVLGWLQENTQGKYQAYDQISYGARFQKSWALMAKKIEFKAEIGSQGRQTDYQERDPLYPKNESDTKGQSRLTTRQMDDVLLSGEWTPLLNSFLTSSVGYSRIRAYSNIEEFSFKNEGWQVRFAGRFLF